MCLSLWCPSTLKFFQKWKIVWFISWGAVGVEYNYKWIPLLHRITNLIGITKLLKWRAAFLWIKETFICIICINRVWWLLKHHQYLHVLLRLWFGSSKYSELLWSFIVINTVIIAQWEATFFSLGAKGSRLNPGNSR